MADDTPIDFGTDAPWLKLDDGDTLCIEFLTREPLDSYERSIKNGPPVPHSDWLVLAGVPDGESEVELRRLTVYGRLRFALIAARVRPEVPYLVTRTGKGTETRYSVRRS